jgi:hypothetical protein
LVRTIGDVDPDGPRAAPAYEIGLIGVEIGRFRARAKAEGRADGVAEDTGAIVPLGSNDRRFDPDGPRASPAYEIGLLRVEIGRFRSRAKAEGPGPTASPRTPERSFRLLRTIGDVDPDGPRASPA